MQAVTPIDASETERDIKRVAAEDRQAAYALMARRYLPGLARHVANVVKDSDEAMDLATETIVRAMSEPRLFDPEFQIGGWLYRVAFNRALNAFRDRKRREAVLTQYGSVLISSVPSDPDKDYAAGELTSTLDRLLHRLSPEHETILRLRHYAGLDYKEIGNRLGVPIGTVMSRLSRAHERLREHVESEGLHEEVRAFL